MEEEAVLHQDEHEHAVDLDIEAAGEARHERDLNRAGTGLNAQAANGSFGQADGNNNELLFQGTGGGNAQAASDSLRSQFRDGKDSKAS